MDFERLFTNFNQEGSIHLSKKEIVDFLIDLFDTALYKKLTCQEQENPVDIIFRDNKLFWEDCLLNNIYNGKTIKLENFCLIEWLPYSPGLYYTDRAKLSRKNANEFLANDKNEYLPLGKLAMVLGGVGSIRLAPVKSQYFLCATSTGISHQGIPIIANKEIYNKFIDEIKTEGYSTVDIVGTIEVLPIEKAFINYDREIPKYSIVVKSITKKPKIRTDILVSISAIFSHNTYDIDFDGSYKRWTFASFKPDPKEYELRKAVEWIEQYAQRYSDSKSIILSDFDENKSHFNSDIEFKLHNVINGNIDVDQLAKYSSSFKIIINKKIMGDNIENNSGNIIKGNTGNIIASNTGNINVSNSFNKVKDKFGEDAANILIKVAEIINKEGNQDAKDQFSSFKEELEKETPKKSVLNSLWKGIAVAIPLIKSSFEIFDKVKTVFGF